MKKSILVITILFLGLQYMLAQNQHSISIDFTGMTSNKGTLYVGLYNSEASFLKKRFRSQKTTIENLNATVTFNNLPNGTYAISAYHDENNNGKMDTKFFIIPNEPVGTSNNAKGKYGPPKFEDAKFVLDRDRELDILMGSL